MTDCLRYAPTIGSREGELTGEEREALAAHLSACEACQARLADEHALDGLLGEAFLREASRRDFSAFVDGVMERVEASQPWWRRLARHQADDEPPRYDAAPTGERRPWEARTERLQLPWWRRHRLLAFGSALAPTLAALGLIVYLRSQGPVPQAGDVEVTSQDHVPMVLQTSDGPVVVLGDGEPEET